MSWGQLKIQVARAQLNFQESANNTSRGCLLKIQVTPLPPAAQSHRTSAAQRPPPPRDGEVAKTPNRTAGAGPTDRPRRNRTAYASWPSARRPWAPRPSVRPPSAARVSAEAASSAWDCRPERWLSGGTRKNQESTKAARITPRPTQ